ncbi:MAG TPA: hypothetical protein VMK65_04615, partial [Longimicrobiales bacterium]|nr:hypothetical protein [Longimicrobiales bacterium]
MARTLHLTAPAARRIREEIVEARGNEVCFVARVGGAGEVFDPAVVARGHRSGVLAAAAEAVAGSLILHNHPSGDLDPS